MAIFCVHLSQDSEEDSVSIIRVGSTKKYADNWQAAFGDKKQSSPNKRTATKKTATAKKKTATKKKAAKKRK